MKVYISGLYSGTNPQPGVGIVRSLREAYPSALLVGVEYSNRCSGIHWQELDDVWLQRPWEELDLDSYEVQIRDVLDDGALWISGVDLEIMWLASVFPNGHPNLLTPARQALNQISKPAVKAHRGLPVNIPEYISTEESDWDLHAFCRKHGWKVWLKGPYYEAVRTHSWDAFERVRHVLSRAWSTDRLFLQAHVTGYEESICFCAYQGELIESVYMKKRELTEEGKTWAGEVTDVPEHIVKSLSKIVAELNWTGGAELEMVRDTADQLWLLECNPRFPAWIHGATIAGRNLPAAIVERASGIPARQSESKGEEFTRVVLEIPIRSDFPLATLPEPFPGAIGHSLKHPSGTLALAERLQKLHIIDGRANDKTNSNSREVAASDNGHRFTSGNGHNSAGDKQTLSYPQLPCSFIQDVGGHELDAIETPAWLFLNSTAASLFKSASNVARELSNSSVKVSNGYSIKTNPDERLLKMAYKSGFLAEAISLLEVQKALSVGFKPGQVILNGPGKWWPPEELTSFSLHAIFADSLPDFHRIVQSLNNNELHAGIVGVRLRPPNIASRFGIALDEPEALSRLVAAVGTLPSHCAFGVHFHMASSNIGVQQWWHLLESMLRWCRSIESLTARRIECLDIGGGWFPDDWHNRTTNDLGSAVQRAGKFLPNVREIIAEPGKAMSQPSMAVAMRLLEFDEVDGEIKEAVVDGSIAELPMHFVQPHRILHRNTESGEWKPLRRGNTNLLGRLCMEHDIVAANVELPEGVRKGDVLVFCDAGAYDRSMSYAFGRG